MRHPRALLALVLLALSAGCGTHSADPVGTVGPGDEASSSRTSNPAPPIPAPPPGAPGPGSAVSLWLSADRVPPGSVDVVGVLVNRSDRDLTFGVGAGVERWNGERWAQLGWLTMCLDHWHCTAKVEGSAGARIVPSIGLVPTVDSPGPAERFTTAGFEPGWYRITQTANDGTVAVGVLQVVEDAVPPAPLVPVDDPAISIRPALTQPGGATVRLQPLIPAPSGSQSITDVEAAVEGLSETAAIERWADARWVPVDEVVLARTPPEQSSVGRSATLPDLVPGAYRFVRTGRGERHIGSFWVQAPEH